MTSPVSNMRGDDVTQDYGKGIAHVRLTLDELRERKLRTDELCDVRRIKLQQLLQLKQSERDAEQVKRSANWFLFLVLHFTIRHCIVLMILNIFRKSEVKSKISWA